MPTLPFHTSHVQLPAGITIYFLTAEDAAAYQKLRLESLQHDPTAFLSLHETESQLHQKLFANHLNNSYHPPYFGFLGVFIDKQLVGYLQVGENSFEKQRHIADIYNVYISPSHRKKGLARLLFLYVFDLLQDSPVERIFLSCTASNKTAYRFYRQLGFQRIGIRSRAIKWKGIYDDEIEMVKVL